MNGDKIKSNVPIKILVAGFTAIIIAVLCYGSTLPSKTIFSSGFSFPSFRHSVSIVVVGDIMLDRNVRNKINKVGFETFTAGVHDLISSADIAVANLEGPFTTNPSVTSSLVSKELKFTFDPKLAPKLADLGFDILGLANNHTSNFGKEGIDSTRQYIEDAGMFYYGEPNNSDELSTVMQKNGVTVGFVGFHEFSYMNFDKVLAEIDRIRPVVDVLVVSPHWGVEYETMPTEKMRSKAHEFIDHGADAVIGAHPHVVGESEEYKGKKIYYSLGNFIFDQYFSEETQNGLALEMEVEKGSHAIKYTEVKIRIDKEGPRVY